MSEACMYIVRMALVLDLLPWGSASQGMSKTELANALKRRGVDIHADSLLRDLKAWQPLLELVCTRDEEGKTYWKRSSRRHGISHLLDMEDFLGEALEDSWNTNDDDGLGEHDLPDWPSDIRFTR